jgi:hypothetical protein
MFYRLICDGWLEVTIPDDESAEQVMSSVIQLRATWQNLLKLRLEGKHNTLTVRRIFELLLHSKTNEELISNCLNAVY